MAEGMAEGKAEATREHILLVCKRRFGSMPPEVEERLRGVGDLDRLQEILERSLDVHSLAELDLDNMD